MSIIIGNRRRNVALLALLFISFSASLWFAVRSSAQKAESASENNTEAFAPEAGTISGRVFQDYNGNGLYETSGGTAAAPLAVDSGVSGVTVSAFNSVGAASGTALTVTNGTYSLPATGTGPYRIEFTNVPSGFLPSARSTDSVLGGSGTDAGSTTQFVNNVDTTNVNLALNRGQDYCEDNPLICSQLYAVGNVNLAESVFTIPYQGGSTRTTGGAPVTDFESPGNTSLATSDQVGTTFGIAYKRTTRQIFAASFMKKHAKFGPGGTGAIYQINRGTGAVSEYVNVNTVFGANTAGADPHDTSNYDTDNGQTTWNAVGKVAFGGMAISDDGASLYTMNLNDRQLYRVPTTGILNSTTITRQAFPATMPDCVNASDVRPFAVTFYEGLLYVGAVCSADVSDLSSDLWGYVYTVNPTTLSFSASPALKFPLNYTRAEVDPGISANWLAWRTNYSTISTNLFIYPQPLLTDIEFDRGNLILGIRDRNGDQTGYNSQSNPNDTTQLSKGITGGDMLRACGSPSLGWTLESNGRCAGVGSSTQGTNEGPGGGEFYYQDNYHPDGNPHDEVSLGGSMQIPGHTEMVATIFDPAYIPTDNIYDAGGFRWFVNGTGAQNRGYLAYASETFGKANGIGNVISLCEAAPIEIGNRVWRDSNGNGVQDPGEPAIAGVSVRLYQGSSPVNYASIPYADGFAAISYGGSTGSTNWSSSPWTEIFDNADPASGDVRVVLDDGFSNALRLERASRGAQRTISLAGSNSATLRFDYRRNGSKGATVEWFNGTTWTVLATYGSGTDAAYQSSGSFALPATATAIRFLNAAANGKNDHFFVDNVQVAALSDTVVTDANGEYYFTGVSPNTAYQIRLDNPANYTSGNPLNSLILTIQNQTAQLGDDDSSDSDASTVANPAGSPAGNFPVISLTTGVSGSNNHTNDFGFYLPPSASFASVSGRIMTANGNGIRNVQVALVEADGTMHVTKTGSFGYYRFDDIVSGQTIAVSLASKRFTFSPSTRLVSLNEELTDFDWIAQE